MAASNASTDALVGPSLTGVRLYNPTSGRFLSTGPVPGGSANAYAYSTNLIDGFDLSGKSWWKKAWRVTRAMVANPHRIYGLSGCAIGSGASLGYQGGGSFASW